MRKWIPLEYKVTVRLQEVEKTTAGGIIEKTDETITQEEMGQVYGTVTEMSDMAFTDGLGKKWNCTLPQIGDEVMFAKYSGLRWTGREDGIKYCTMHDKDIVAVKGK